MVEPGDILTLFKPSEKKMPPKPFKRTLKANSDHPLTILDLFLLPGEEGPELKDGESATIIKDVNLTVEDVEDRVYSTKTPEDYPVLIRINDGPYKGAHGYVERKYFTRVVPQENSKQQQLEEEDNSFLPPELR